ncbi:hypothetical protein CDAR_288761 [Caerostris darwini]|uniref:Uncharacterized protein n=1 Tax=Caerostris darwini TaxID=1538125 RepID=A0AAV4UEV4_9ARAC|nr:hypothetical protein CDAR_288761 [Caerostris darwini]
METNTSRSRSMSLPIIWGDLELSDEGILKLCSQTSFVDSELLKAHETAVIKILAVQKQQLEKGYTHCITYQRNVLRRSWMGNLPKGINTSEYWFTQDGAPPHRTLSVFDIINNKFGTRVIAYQYPNSYPITSALHWDPYSQIESL